MTNKIKKQIFRPVIPEVDQALLISQKWLNEQCPGKLVGRNKLINLLILLGAEVLSQTKLPDEEFKRKVMSISRSDSRRTLDLESLQDDPEALQQAYSLLKIDQVREIKRTLRRQLKFASPRQIQQIEKSGINVEKLREKLDQRK